MLHPIEPLLARGGAWPKGPLADIAMVIGGIFIAVVFLMKVFRPDDPDPKDRAKPIAPNQDAPSESN